MSCFICSDSVFRSVTKVCFYYGVLQVALNGERNGCPSTIDKCNEFMKKVAELNCRNVATRYKEEQQEVDVPLFENLPFEKITAQDVKSCDCWTYQTCDYCDNDALFKLVVDARDWAKSVVSYSHKEYDEAEWG